jgi:predicted RNase H-like HicB family nuclease
MIPIEGSALAHSRPEAAFASGELAEKGSVGRAVAYLSLKHGRAGWGLPEGGGTMGGYQLTAIIEREGGLFVARCVELDITSQGGSEAAVLSNLKEAVSMLLQHAEEAEILERLARHVGVTLFEVDPR